MSTLIRSSAITKGPRNTMYVITVKKNCEFSHDVLDHRRCNPQVQPSMSFDDHTNTPSTCRGKNFLSPEFGAKFKREVALFLKVLEFSYITE